MRAAFLGHLRLRQAAGLAQADDQRRRAGCRSAARAPARRRRTAAPAGRAGRRRTNSAPTPLGPYSLWPLIEARSTRQPVRSSGILPAAWAMSVWNSAPACLAMAARRGDVLHHADLVVHRHDADQQRRLGQRVAQGVGVEQAVRAHRQEDGLEAFVGEVGDRFQHAFMLGRDGDDAPALVAHARRRSGRRP